MSAIHFITAIMATNYWKKFEKSSFFQSAKLKVRQLYGREPKFALDLAVKNTQFGDWGLPLNYVKDGDVVYSFGICDDIDFELALLQEKAVTVYAFDPTPYSVNWIADQELPGEFIFTPLACAASDGQFYLYPLINKGGDKSTTMFSFHEQQEDRDDGVLVEALTLKSTMNKMSHDAIDVLKMDVEGAEYAVIEGMLTAGILPKMVMVEFHHRFKGMGKEKTIKAVNDLKQAGYLIVYISPAGREICFLHQNCVVK